MHTLMITIIAIALGATVGTMTIVVGSDVLTNQLPAIANIKEDMSGKIEQLDEVKRQSGFDPHVVDMVEATKQDLRAVEQMTQAEWDKMCQEISDKAREMEGGAQ